MKVIHWFRQDLRLHDNPSLTAAASQGVVLPLYINDNINTTAKPLGAASRCWLHHSLSSLASSLNDQLVIQQGDPLSILKKLIAEYQINAIHWNRCYEPYHIDRDKNIKAELQKQGIEIITHNSSLLWEPWEVNKKNGENYKIFTPFYRKGCLQAMPPRTPIDAPKKMKIFYPARLSLSLSELTLLPTINWDQQIMKNWQAGESAAKKGLNNFIENGLSEYHQGRNFPAQHNISRLSPHLHWGEISPNQLWYEIKKHKQDDNTDCFLSELGWREFSYYLLYHHPSLYHKNLQSKFDNMPWKKNKKQLNAWQQGKTGYPLVDAGMRELWQTGFMHNRVRMITASFLVKNLMLHWREGEQWFWDCLLDADLASNSASWQWVAGCGTDAAPFFRIFNPTTQAEKFDSHAEYLRQYLPELSKLPDRYIFSPSTAPASTLAAAGVTLGKNYPQPIIDLKQSRERALTAFKSLKK